MATDISIRSFLAVICLVERNHSHKIRVSQGTLPLYFKYIEMGMLTDSVHYLFEQKNNID